MKRFFFFIFLLGIAMFALPHAYAQPQAGERIVSYDVGIEILPSSDIRVEEYIVYDFGPHERHGIYRDIPVRYETPYGTRSIRISDIEVTNLTNQVSAFDETRNGGNVRLRIGDQDITISGEHEYLIVYTVSGAFNYFDEHDELYWNAIGTQWDVPIGYMGARVIFPMAVSAEEVQYECFAGAQGSQDACMSAELLREGERAVMVEFGDGGEHMIGEGMTVVAGFPKGIVAQASAAGTLVHFISDNPIVLLPGLVLIVLLLLWSRRGRDPRGRGSIVVQYEPPEDDIAPSEAGTILDEKVHHRDLVADIIQLAVDGYITITREAEKKWGLFNTEDFLLTKVTSEEPIKAWQQGLMRDLFVGDDREVRVSEFDEKIYEDVWKRAKDIYRAVAEKGYFVANPRTIKSIYMIIGGLVVFGAFMFGELALGSLVGMISVVLSGALFILFAFIMPAKTQKGVEMREYLLGLREYIETAEKERIAFHNAPEKDPERFEKLLPYAIMFKAENEWAQKFEDVYTEPPRWYYGGGRAFTAQAFAADIGRFQKSAHQAFTQGAKASGGGSGFGGGGFSGGGFGGGGGGSW